MLQFVGSQSQTRLSNNHQERKGCLVNARCAPGAGQGPMMQREAEKVPAHLEPALLGETENLSRQTATRC